MFWRALLRLFGVGKRERYDFKKIDRLLGEWRPYEGNRRVERTRLPRYLDIPAALVAKGKGVAGEVPLKVALFPYWLRLSPAYCGYLARRVREGALYSTIEILRENKSPRVIESPAPFLKLAQRRIAQRLLDQIDIHPAARGFVTGESIFTAASPHVGKRVVVSMDLRDFFGTITYPRVLGMFAAYGFDENVGRLLAGLCCRGGRLPQGAPTSPMICNIVCKRLDARLHGLCAKNGYAYTRYADDLIFSGDAKVIRLLPKIREIIAEEGFVPAEEKTRIARSGSRQRVLGVNVNDKVSLPRETRRLVRAMTHRLATGDARLSKAPYYVRGYLAFMNVPHPEQSAKLKQSLSALPPA